jgi:hypothetical protein
MGPCGLIYDSVKPIYGGTSGLVSGANGDTGEGLKSSTSARLLPLLDVIDRLGGCNPSLCLHVVDRRLNPLRIVLRKKPQVFTADFDFSPKTIRQHSENRVAVALRPLIKRNCLSITYAFSCDLEFVDCIPQSDRQ